MDSISLRSGWKFRQAGTQEWLPAQVPGGVHTDLLALGRILDPFVADNELKVQWVAERDWEYQTSFDLSADTAAAPHLFLVCDGLDTLADVTLNGNLLGKSNNMFIQIRYDVTGLVKAGKNDLAIFFHGPVTYIKEQQALRPMVGGGTILGGPHLRKAPCHFGWDWGPNLPPIGIWRDIRLENIPVARVADVHLRQQHRQTGVTVSADVTAEVFGAQALIAHLKMTSPDGQVFEASSTLKDGQARLEVLVKNPQLWWPNGYGSQPLYTVEVTLSVAGNTEDSRVYKLGLRTVEVRQEPDQWGKSFYFVVNGVPVFAKGSDWIPADSFPTRMTEARYEQLISSAAEAHQNMLRVWGGGFYEEEIFYDLCDRYGLLIWQDFIFACGIYPFDEPTFLENLRVEVDQNVRRLRNRTCLALWCGNNEMEQGWADWGYTIPGDPERMKLREAYGVYFYTTLPKWVNALDGDRLYWPSSASSNVMFENPNGQAQGDTHYWDVWHGRKPFTAYRSQFPRFMSEFGFQSLPPMETVKTYAQPKDWNMTSYIMEHHQRNGSGNGLIIGQMTDTFRMPKDFDALTYLSMVLQAEGIRYGVEHWRRNKNRVGGTLIWQLNDCWPVASWASVDYYGRWKALHYAAKRFYAPVMLSIEDTQTQMDIHVTSDLTVLFAGMVRWHLLTLDGKTVQSGEVPVSVPALESVKICTLDFKNAVLGGENLSRELFFAAELFQDDQRLAVCLATFAPNKHLELVEPGLKVAVHEKDGRAVFEATAGSLARFVELKLEGADAVFSDNYFDVPAGWKVAVSCPIPAGWSIAQVKKALQVRSLYDSFAD